MEVIWSEQAEQSLASIVEFIAKDNVRAALEMDILLQNAAEGLVIFPHKGKPGRVPGTRELVAHEHYILVYRLTDNAVYIVSVLHASMLWPPLQNT
ncbi:MAG: type II toxin-antitoxin system RelE/ParE family toxin [Desulfovibrionaceae bacterium]|nr:type II toxin-antitoxin system RelE/ParE family toxin [Desulfovibrionaceae bacterium]